MAGLRHQGAGAPAQGAGLAGPDERTTATAVDAERHLRELHRVCGRFGSVTVYGPNGKAVGPLQLASVARAERGSNNREGAAMVDVPVR